MRLLIIDDSPTAREALENAGALAGFTCAAVGSELEAMAVMEREECHALLVDAHLDLGVSGLDVGRRFKERHPTLKVAIVTASIDPRLASSARTSGFKLLTKPLTGDDLLRTYGQPQLKVPVAQSRDAQATAEIVAREVALARAGLSNAMARDERRYWAHRIKGLAIVLQLDDMRELAGALERACEGASDQLCEHLLGLLIAQLDAAT